MLAGARALAVTVGPAALTEELLAARRSDQPLAWNVKADADAFPLAIRRRLVQEAAVICLNRDELPFVAAALSSSAPGEVDERALIAAIVHGGGGLVVVTAGAAGCRVASPGGWWMCPRILSRLPTRLAPATHSSGRSSPPGWVTPMRPGRLPPPPNTSRHSCRSGRRGDRDVTRAWYLGDDSR